MVRVVMKEAVFIFRRYTKYLEVECHDVVSDDSAKRRGVCVRERERCQTKQNGRMVGAGNLNALFLAHFLLV